MKLHAEIVAQLASLIEQRDSRLRGSMSFNILNQRCMALAWVLEHELAPDDLTLGPCELHLMESFE